MTGPYLETDVRQSYRWLAHDPHHTELAALHPDYRPGRENANWNREHDAYPRVGYVTTERQLLGFVRRYAPTRMVCYSLNPRIGMKLEEHGFPIASRETDIDLSQNLLLDFDLDGEPTSDRLKKLAAFLDEKVSAYFADNGFQPPTRAYSGGGHHLLAAYAPIPVADHPDIRTRLGEFRNRICQAFRGELSRLEAKLDQTQDLRRLVKIYGTSKPRRPVSRFHGEQRREDAALRQHLLDLEITPNRRTALSFPTHDHLPPYVAQLLSQDAELSRLWRGEGKQPRTDTTRSGYDYAVVHRALQLGVTDLSDLATILKLRPRGAVGTGAKGDDYIRRTIAAALVR